MKLAEWLYRTLARGPTDATCTPSRFTSSTERAPFPSLAAGWVAPPWTARSIRLNPLNWPGGLGVVLVKTASTVTTISPAVGLTA